MTKVATSKRKLRKWQRQAGRTVAARLKKLRDRNAAPQYRHEDVATVPRGWRVRTVTQNQHQVRIAFPPGPRKKGSGRLISILHPKGENPKKCNAVRGSIGGKRSKGRKGNTVSSASNASSASQLYTDFHGRRPSEVLTMQEALMTSGDYTVLGDMGALWIEGPLVGAPSHWPDPTIEFEKQDKVKVVSDAEGKQLYLVGGNQKLPLDYLEKKGISTDKRFVALGEVYAISYLTKKSFDRDQAMEYAHEFGEKTGERPFAYYDAEVERIVLVGGGYSIAPYDEVLGASPGIVN